MISKKRLFLILSTMVSLSVVSNVHGRGSEEKEGKAICAARIARVAIRSSILLGAMVLTNCTWDCSIADPFHERYEEVSSYDDNAKYWEAAKTLDKCLRFIVNAYYAKIALSKSFWR